MQRRLPQDCNLGYQQYRPVEERPYRRDHVERGVVDIDCVTGRAGGRRVYGGL